MNVMQVLEVFFDGIGIAKTARRLKKTASLLKFVNLMSGFFIIAVNIYGIIKALNRPKLA